MLSPEMPVMLLLLEQIFLQSLNENFPLASSHLGTVLSSTHLKMSLVFKVFSSNDTSPGLEHRNHLLQIHGAGRGCTYRELRAIGKLPSRILACRWMTWEFVKQYTENCIVEALLREFRVQNLPWPEGFALRIQKICNGMAEHQYESQWSETLYANV